MIPRRIYDQPISNFPNATWLREMADQEHEHDPLPESVAPASTAPQTPAPRLVETNGRSAAMDPSPTLARY